MDDRDPIVRGRPGPPPLPVARFGSLRVRVWVAVGVGVAGLCGLGVAAWILRERGPVGFLPGCLFHRATGWHCPGCGMTRAAHAVLHGDIAGAFRSNPLGVVLLPLAAAGLGVEALGWVRGRPMLLRLQPGGMMARWRVGVVLASWLLRTLPWWPFSWLAPG